MILVLSVTVCHRHCKQRKLTDSKSHSHCNLDNSITVETELSGESGMEHVYQDIYSTPGYTFRDTNTNSPRLPPSRTLQQMPQSQYDICPPGDLAPIPPIQNPLQGMDLPELYEEPGNDHKEFDDVFYSLREDPYRSGHKRAKGKTLEYQQYSDEHGNRSPYADHTRTNRQTLDVPLPSVELSSHIPNRVDVQRYMDEPALPQTPPAYDGAQTGQWGWATSSRPSRY